MVNTFSGDLQFLSNFWPVEIMLDLVTRPENVGKDGLVYRSVEHAFQAAKTENLTDRAQIASAPAAGAAKRLGRKVTIRPEWKIMRLELMESLLRQKFSSACLRARLCATGDEELIEGNWWGDVFWGQCNGVGENHLGRLLMKLRTEFRRAEVPDSRAHAIL